MRDYNRYPDGYLPKIQYWSNTMQEAIGRKDLVQMDRASEKLAYFIKREKERKGYSLKELG